MTREELAEVVASTICCHTRMSPAVQWEIDLLMGAIDRHVDLEVERKTRQLHERLRLLTDEAVARVVGPNIDLLCEEIQKLRASAQQALFVAEVIEANGIKWAADSVRRAVSGEAA